MVNGEWDDLDAAERKAKYLTQFWLPEIVFRRLCNRDVLQEYVRKQDGVFRNALRSGIGAGTAGGICNETYRLTASLHHVHLHLHHVWLEVPSRQRSLRGIEGHHVIKGSSMYVGAVDGSHTPMRAPKVRPHDSYNRTGFHYIVLQGTVDCLGRVTDIDIQSFFFRSQVELTTLASSGAVT